MTTLPTRDQLIQHVTQVLIEGVVDNHLPTVDAVVDSVLLPYLEQVGSADERVRVTEAVAHASASWEAANGRQKAAIDRLLDANRELKAQLSGKFDEIARIKRDTRTEIDQLENVALDLNRRDDQLADAVGGVDTGD